MKLEPIGFLDTMSMGFRRETSLQNESRVFAEPLGVWNCQLRRSLLERTAWRKDQECRLSTVDIPIVMSKIQSLYESGIQRGGLG